jgi:membrane protein
MGAIAATILWELTRHALVWYFATLSQVGTVYGSLTTAIVVLLSFEVASTLLIFGAQVIAEYERIGRALAGSSGAGDADRRKRMLCMD